MILMKMGNIDLSRLRMCKMDLLWKIQKMDSLNYHQKYQIIVTSILVIFYYL